jgi:hypothetical protein
VHAVDHVQSHSTCHCHALHENPPQRLKSFICHHLVIPFNTFDTWVVFETYLREVQAEKESKKRVFQVKNNAPKYICVFLKRALARRACPPSSSRARDVLHLFLFHHFHWIYWASRSTCADTEDLPCRVLYTAVRSMQILGEGGKSIHEHMPFGKAVP